MTTKLLTVADVSVTDLVGEMSPTEKALVGHFEAQVANPAAEAEDKQQKEVATAQSELPQEVTWAMRHLTQRGFTVAAADLALIASGEPLYGNDLAKIRWNLEDALKNSRIYGPSRKTVYVYRDKAKERAMQAAEGDSLDLFKKFQRALNSAHDLLDVVQKEKRHRHHSMAAAARQSYNEADKVVFDEWAIYAIARLMAKPGNEVAEVRREDAEIASSVSAQANPFDKTVRLLDMLKIRLVDRLEAFEKSLEARLEAGAERSHRHERNGADRAERNRRGHNDGGKKKKQG